jgi:hypothetical protein
MSNSSQPKSWRDVLPIHPAAGLFPPMSESELRELGEDIKKNGLQNLITLCNYKNTLCVLDGRNRLDAMELAGIKTSGDDVNIFRACKTDPYEFVISANIHRRHLTTEQKRELIAKLLKAKPEQSDRQIANQIKASPTWVGKIRKEAEAAGDVSTVDTRTDTKGRKQPSTKPKKLAKPTPPRENDQIGTPPVCDSEAPATSVRLESRRGSVSAKDIALEDFSARAMELIRLTKKNNAERFANTSLSFKDLWDLGHFFLNLANVCEKKCKAEHDAKREAEVTALLGEAAS